MKVMMKKNNSYILSLPMFNFRVILVCPTLQALLLLLLKHFAQGFHQGITVTLPGLYGHKEECFVLELEILQLIDRLTDFSFGQHRITNFEMETSAIYGLGKLLGHHCLAIKCNCSQQNCKRIQ